MSPVGAKSTIGHYAEYPVSEAKQTSVAKPEARHIRTRKDALLLLCTKLPTIGLHTTCLENVVSIDTKRTSKDKAFA